MAYANKLPTNKFNKYYDVLQSFAALELKNKVDSELKTKGKVKHRFYSNNWVKVLNLWTNNKLTNLAVYDMVKYQQVTIDIELMLYSDSLV